MDVFVRSAGYAPDCGYHWQRSEPPQWNKIYKLIESESLSVVLTRDNGQLSLFVTGLESPGKRDFRNRLIRHSVAWMCDDNFNNEKQVRAIAIQALRGKLSSQFDRFVAADDKLGFKVAFSEIEELGQFLLKNEIEVDNQPLSSPQENLKIGKNSEELRTALSHELIQYSLPRKNGLLIVVTGNKAEALLKQAGSWRSLSKLVKTEFGADDEWKDLPKSEVNQSDPPQAAIAIIVVGIVIIAALILLIVLLHPLTQKPQERTSPAPTSSPTNQLEERNTSQQKSVEVPSEPGEVSSELRKVDPGSLKDSPNSRTSEIESVQEPPKALKS